MSAKTIFSLYHILPDQLDMIYESILNFKKFGQVHPFIKEVTLIQDNHPDFKEYKVIEEIYFLGFIKSHPTYVSKVMEIEKDKHIRYTSQVKKFIFLTVDIRFSEEKNKAVLITETFEIRSAKIIGMVFASILKKAHLQFFKNLKLLLQNTVEI